MQTSTVYPREINLLIERQLSDFQQTENISKLYFTHVGNYVTLRSGKSGEL